MSKSILFAAGAALACLCASPGLAKESRKLIVERVTVSHADLDLRTHADAEAMLARLDRAASDACGGRPAPTVNMDGLAAAIRREHRRCTTATLEAAVHGLGAPLVSAAYVSRGPDVRYASKEH